MDFRGSRGMGGAGGNERGVKMDINTVPMYDILKGKSLNLKYR